MKRRWDSVPTGDSAPAGDSAPTVSLVLEDESALKKKVAQYIVENSDLRRQMQQQQRMHDEVDDGGECEVDAPGEGGGVRGKEAVAGRGVCAAIAGGRDAVCVIWLGGSAEGGGCEEGNGTGGAEECHRRSA